MANVQINPSQSALQNLLNLIDSQNPSGPTRVNAISTSNLTAVTVGSISSDPTANTSVQVTGVEGQGYDGSVTIYYTREALSDQVSTTGGTASVASADTAAQLLTAVAEQYNLIPSEISWVATPAVGATTGTIQSSGSLVYTDGEATVNLSWTYKTAALFHFDGTTPATVATDSLGHPMTVAGSAGTHETDTKKFGTGAYWGNANGSYFSTPDASDLRLTGDFTIEWWIWASVASGAFVSKGAAKINYVSTGSKIEVIGDSGAIILSAAIFSPSAWQSVAVVKQGTTWTLYASGSEVATATSSDTWGNNSSPLVIGNDASTSYDSPLEAYIDELRLSNVARYSANYTPATAAFTVD